VSPSHLPIEERPVATKERNVVESGIMLGVICLALIVIFAVGITRWHKHSDTASIDLPNSLSGGLAKVVDPQLTDAITKQVSNATDVTGAAAAIAEYQDAQQKTGVIVQATRTPMGALLPVASGTYSTVGDAKCLEDSTAQATICRRSNGDFTVQVTATDSATAAKYATEVYDDITHKSF
jgi:hypothetical protein